MSSAKFTVVIVGALISTGYVLSHTQEQRSRLVLAQQAQEIKLASLKVAMARQQANREAYVVKEKVRLNSTGKQLAEARRALAQLMNQWNDAREQVLANGRVADPTDELRDEERRQAEMRKQMDVLTKRIGQVEVKKTAHIAEMEKQKRVSQGEYASQTEALWQDIDQLQALQPDPRAPKDAGGERKEADQQLADLQASESTLQQQQIYLEQSHHDLIRQVTLMYANQRADLSAQREKLQQQIASSAARCDELKIEIADHNKRMDTDKAVARILQDRVKTQEDLVAQLTTDLATVRQRVDSVVLAH
jgi:chromosome segregation ATPase